jgi:hypothetical protein
MFSSRARRQHILGGMEITRDEPESLIVEALMRELTFRPKRRHWSETREQDERRARITAAAIVTFLYGCGLRWEKRPALPLHRTPRE